MAEIKISELTPKGAVVDPTDLFIVSVFNGTTYDTYSVSGSDIIAGLTAPNFADTDLTLSADRTHDFDGKDMTWDNVKTFTAEANNAPTPMFANFNFLTYGTGGSDVGFRIKSQLSTTMETYGDNNVKMFQQVGVNGASPSASYGLHSGGGTVAGLRGDGTVYGVVGSGGTAGFYTVSSAGYGLQASTTTGVAIQATTDGSGVSIHSDGRSYTEEYGLGAGMSGSAIYQINSTTRGFLPPRHTEAQMNAVSSPATGLRVYNTDRGELMYNHGTFGWVGDSLPLSMGTGATSTVTSTTYYFSANTGLALRLSATGLGVKPTKKGKIIGASFTRYISSILGDRSYSLYVRINNTTDYLVATVGTTAVESFFTNNALNSTGIPVDPATDSIVMKLVVSGGTTDSTNVVFFGSLLMR